MNRWKLCGMHMLVVSVVVACGLMAFASSSASYGQPTWWEHVDLMQVVIGGLFMLILWFTARTLKKIDTNQTNMFRMIDDLRKDFYTLKGEHEARKDRCGKG